MNTERADVYEVYQNIDLRWPVAFEKDRRNTSRANPECDSKKEVEVKSVPCSISDTRHKSALKPLTPSIISKHDS